jgi:hypothetical protein
MTATRTRARIERVFGFGPFDVRTQHREDCCNVPTGERGIQALNLLHVRRGLALMFVVGHTALLDQSRDTDRTGPSLPWWMRES